MFEYGMLKVRNHADGFQDEVIAGNGTNADPDGKMFALTTPRSSGMEMKYSIEAQTGSYVTSVKSQDFVIVPLSIGK